jgi:hypothetical protein
VQMSLPGAFSPTRMRLDMMQSAAKSEPTFFVAWKSPRSTRSGLANPPNAAWHLTCAICFSAVWLPAPPVFLPVAVSGAVAVYGGVPALFLARQLLHSR